MKFSFSEATVLPPYLSGPIPLSSVLKDRHRGRVWEALPQDREIPLLLRLTKSVAFNWWVLCGHSTLSTVNCTRGEHGNM